LAGFAAPGDPDGACVGSGSPSGGQWGPLLGAVPLGSSGEQSLGPALAARKRAPADPLQPRLVNGTALVSPSPYAGPAPGVAGGDGALDPSLPRKHSGDAQSAHHILTPALTPAEAGMRRAHSGGSGADSGRAAGDARTGSGGRSGSLVRAPPQAQVTLRSLYIRRLCNSCIEVLGLQGIGSCGNPAAAAAVPCAYVAAGVSVLTAAGWAGPPRSLCLWSSAPGRPCRRRSQPLSRHLLSPSAGRGRAMARWTAPGWLARPGPGSARPLRRLTLLPAPTRPAAAAVRTCPPLSLRTTRDGARSGGAARNSATESGPVAARLCALAA
jgi:hypothetical protein